VRWLAVIVGLMGLVLAASAARAERLTVALSVAEIKIDSSFDGAPVTVFGVIERDAQTVPRGGPYEIAVLVLGPPESVVARRKERFFGIWVNRTSEVFLGAPSFYAVGATGEVDALAAPELLKRLRLGFDNIGFTYRGRPGRDNPAAAEFREAFLRIKERQGLYSHQPGSVAFIGNTIFRSTVQVPANAPIGFYQVSAFLFADGALLARTDESFTIDRTGFEQLTFTFAHEQAFVYGIACVCLALFTGWLAGVIFRRD
jgi:uncharacterized protein (TIGR02186 family)